MQEEEKCKSKRKERRGRDEQREEGGEETEDSRMKKTDKRKRRKEMVPLAEGGKKRKGWIWKHTHTYCTLPKMSVNHREYSVFSVFLLSPLTESTVCVCSNSRSGGRH